ncbi:Fc.00g015150.m01.CDS01 [Cosmosporella sp. VM-42]
MAQPQPSLSGAERIRALKDEDSVFQAFNAYPWKKDKMFMSGLYAILGEPNQQNPQASLSDMAIHARVFYYAQRIGVTIDFARYQAWVAGHPDRKAPDVLPEEYIKAQQPAAPVLDWQKAAPKADLYVDRKAAAQSGSGDGPDYPMGFAEMLKLLQEGKPVPGIRQIPNTVVRDPSVKPVGARAAPRKPWEKDVVAPVPTLSSVPQALDTEFPPIDDP